MMEEFPKGEWLRMSDLSEKDDDRYKCSHCGNVIHYKSRLDLYTFNSWCGRCGSDNRRHTTIIEADKLEENAPTCKDTISRQGAIDAIYKCTDIYINNLPIMIDKAETYKAISELPSAQPEPHYCRECKWSRCHINVDKYGNTETYWHCFNWDGGTDEEGYCYEWERRTNETD